MFASRTNLMIDMWLLVTMFVTSVMCLQGCESWKYSSRGRWISANCWSVFLGFCLPLKIHAAMLYNIALFKCLGSQTYFSNPIVIIFEPRTNQNMPKASSPLLPENLSVIIQKTGCPHLASLTVFINTSLTSWLMTDLGRG